MKTKVLQILSWLFGMGMLLTSMSAFAQSPPPLKVTAIDTIAGYSTVLKTSRGVAETEVTFRIENPLGTVLELEAVTNEIGVGEIDLYGFHTRTAGVYSVSAYYRDYRQEQPMVSHFQVYPDTVSTSESDISTDSPSVSADGVTVALIKVVLKDQYGNPVSDHKVTLISSRSEDVLQEVSPGQPTDLSGKKFFEVSSKQEGVSHFTVLDATSGVTVNQRAKIIFFAPAPEKKAPASSSFLANIFGSSAEPRNTSGPVQRFELEFVGPNDQFNTAVVGTDDNYFTIRAFDAQNSVVEGYTGSVLISTSDPNAKLPNNGEYTFRESDQGSRQFSLAFQFSQTGTQLVEVFEFDSSTGTISRNVRGQLEVNVVESGDVIRDNLPQPSEAIIIKTPQEGSRYNTRDITLTGVGLENSDLRVFLDGTEVTKVSTDSTGMFFGNVVAEDGQHEIYLQSANGNRVISSVVSFSVDTKGPVFQDFKVSPQGEIEAGKILTMTVVSEPKMGVKIRFDGSEYTLEESDTKPGNYEYSFVVESTEGEYPIDILLSDPLGNESTFLAYKVVTIKKEKKSLPDTVSNVSVVPLQESVRLTWDPVDDVALYIVEGGTSEFRLKNMESVSFTETSATVENLEAGKEYVFRVKAMDTTGNFSLEGETVTAIPLFSDGSEMEGSSVQGVQASPGDGSVLLTWEKLPGKFDRYVVSYGIAPRRYSESKIVPFSQNSLQVENLINGVTYYFRITPYAGKKMGENAYPEVAVTPQFSGLHPAAKPPVSSYRVPRNTSSGPEAAFLFIGISFLMVSMFFFTRRKQYL